MNIGKYIKNIIPSNRAMVTILLAIDIATILVSYFIAFMFRFYLGSASFDDIMYFYSSNSMKILIAAGIYIAFMAIKNQYSNILMLAGIYEYTNGVLAIIYGCVINVAISFITETRISLAVTIFAAIIIMILTNGVRIGYRYLGNYLRSSRFNCNDDIKKVLIIGAGSGGVLVLNEYRRHPKLNKEVVAFIDDNCDKLGKYIGGIKVIGNRDDIVRVCREENIKEIVIAISELDRNSLKDIVEKCKDAKAQVKIMPGISELMEGTLNINKMRDVDVEDLLGRDPIKLDFDGISQYIENKVVLVTGGGGSIGSELCRQIVKFKPEQLIILDIYENNAYEIQNELIRNYPNLKLKTLIASVRDKKRLKDIYTKYKPQVVFHAAAHKHVPLMEESPQEAIKNNVVGTYNVAEVSDKFNVERFVLISTDKAVNPTNVMGATKRVCEMIIQSFDKVSKTEFVAVRFGNVLGSNGSVVPLFKKQILAGGPVTLTHKDITRYFMTIPEAAQLVLQAGAYAKGGEIFVLDMGQPVKIYDLAVNLIKLSGLELGKDINIEITGLRPGEKLYEELLMDEEGLTATENHKIFIGQPGSFELDKLTSEIKELSNIASLDNKALLKNKLKEVVPTYKEPKEVNAAVDKEDIKVAK